MDESGSSPETSLAGIREVFNSAGGAGTPLTTKEVADELDCEQKAASEKLTTLAAKGTLKRKETGADNCIWWMPADEQQTAGEIEREEEYQALVQAVKDYAIFMVDPDGYIQTWNKGAKRIKGYREEEILGEHLSEFYPDDADTEPDHLLNQAAVEGSIEDEGWRVRKDGKKFWARVTITALYDENDDLRGFVKITRDLSDRHEREEALRRERDITEQFRLLVENVEEYAIFMMDPDGYIQSWNTGAEKVKGYSEEEIVGEHFSTFYPEEAVKAGTPEENLKKAQERGYLNDEGWRVRKNGERFWANVTITPIQDDGELRGFAKVTRDMTERHEYEEQLRQEKERFQRMVEEVQDYAIFMLNPEGYIQTWNEGAERIKGYQEADVLGEHLSLFYPEDEGSASPDELLAQAAAQGRIADEGWRIRKDGSRFWASVVITALYDDDGELRGFAKITRDLTERKRREDRLTALDEMGRHLLETETPREVSETVIDAAEGDLDLPITSITLYDDESGTLQPHGQTTRAAQVQSNVPFLNPTSDFPWEVFGNDEPLVIDDLADHLDRESDEHPVTSGIITPVGKHGVFITGFESVDTPSDEEIDFVKIVAADLEAALNHVERQQLLREREATLEEQNESLTRVNRINSIIRTIDQALIDASTRGEIEQAVCTELAASGPYRVAWIGRRESASETLTSVAWAGADATYGDEYAITADDGPTENHPAGLAAQSHESQTIQDIRSDPPFEPWRKEALKRGYRSLISVPILYEESLYGVLTVQADQPETFTGMEAQVIEELGETVAHAINALESKQALVSDEIVELEFQINDLEVPILQLVDYADCAYELDNVLSHEDGSISVFFTTHGAAPAVIEEFVDQSFAVSDLRLITEDEDECVFEATITEESFVATLLDHGAVPQTITAEEGNGRVVVSLPTQADVREFIEMLQSKYGDLDLTARRTRERTARTPDEFKAAFEDRITDRQREVLQTAYFSGFFDTPRKSTGEEIGDALGVSQPTVNHHLRACQRELLAMLYDES
ncbi:PAS domain S-box protein [Natrinema amylolyticum]|uniref:PAS domain S-box protein n=1 Tax=Natrinema amylolyticum TaxID=2878679 RepID=UPI001CFAD37C|nr:PAS domain S-box protein [Natrinema amylolyticum]